jgi:hypothetical protein
MGAALYQSIGCVLCAVCPWKSQRRGAGGNRKVVTHNKNLIKKYALNEQQLLD